MGLERPGANGPTTWSLWFCCTDTCLHHYAKGEDGSGCPCNARLCAGCGGWPPMLMLPGEALPATEEATVMVVATVAVEAMGSSTSCPLPPASLAGYPMPPASAGCTKCAQQGALIVKTALVLHVWMRHMRVVG